MDNSILVHISNSGGYKRFLLHSLHRQETEVGHTSGGNGIVFKIRGGGKSKKSRKKSKSSGGKTQQRRKGVN